MNRPALSLPSPSRLSPFVLVAVALGLGCQGAKIRSVGGDTGTGAAGGAGGNGSGGATGGTGPDLTIHLPDASTSDAPGAETGPTMPGVGAPTCADEAHDGKMVPIDLLMLVDVSGSMEESAGAKSKWVSVRDALEGFLKDPKSAGLGAGLQFFPPPVKSCSKDTDCGTGFLANCQVSGVCGTVPDLVTTEDFCDAGNNLGCGFVGADTCNAYGLCAKTGLRCPMVGQPCAGGMAGDTCMPRPGYCNYDEVAACSDDHYAMPAVAVGDLPGVEPAVSAALAATAPEGGTPTTAAVRGALTYLTARAAATPDRKQVLVLATDGIPQGCQGNSIASAATVLGAAQKTTPSIPTYVIGVFPPNDLQASAALGQLATAGGSGMPFVLSTGDDLTQKFQAALDQIRGSALGCEFTIPAPTKGTIDFDKVNVRYNGPSGGQDLTYVGSVDKCDPAKGGWYYDADPATGKPTHVLLCKATCDQVQSTTGTGSIQLRFGCKTRID